MQDPFDYNPSDAKPSDIEDAKIVPTEVPEEPKKKESKLVQMKDSMKRTRAMVKIVGGSALTVGAIVVAAPLLGGVMLLSLGVAAVAFMATIFYALKFVKEKFGYEVNFLNFMKGADGFVNNNKDVNVKTK